MSIAPSSYDLPFGFCRSKVLGHSRPSTTLDIYGHLIPVYQDDVARLMDELVTPIPVKLGERAGFEPHPGQS